MCNSLEGFVIGLERPGGYIFKGYDRSCEHPNSRQRNQPKEEEHYATVKGQFDYRMQCSQPGTDNQYVSNQGDTEENARAKTQRQPDRPDRLFHFGSLEHDQIN